MAVGAWSGKNVEAIANDIYFSTKFFFLKASSRQVYTSNKIFS